MQALSSFIAFLNKSSLIFYKTFLGKQRVRGDNGSICVLNLYAHVQLIIGCIDDERTDTKTRFLSLISQYQ